jgi:hypothetical protein
MHVGTLKLIMVVLAEESFEAAHGGEIASTHVAVRYLLLTFDDRGDHGTRIESAEPGGAA